MIKFFFLSAKVLGSKKRQPLSLVLMMVVVMERLVKLRRECRGHVKVGLRSWAIRSKAALSRQDEWSRMRVLTYVGCDYTALVSE